MRHIIAQGASLNHPVSVDIFENHLFYTALDDGSVVQLDKFGRGVPVVISRDLPNPRAVRIVHPLKYNTSLSNPCSESNRNGPCSHLCLLTPGGGSRCKCPANQGYGDRERVTCDARKLDFA